MQLAKVLQSAALALFLTVFSFVIGVSGAFATTHTISFGGVSFSPSTLNVQVGDIIVFSGSFTSHIIESISVPSGASTFGPTTFSTTSLSYTVTVAGTYNYDCSLHASMGMTGSFTATAASTKAFSLSAATVTFGTLRVGTNGNKSITLTSTGPDAALTISSSPLSIGTSYSNSPTGTNRSIAVNSTENEVITFSPASRGTFYDTLTINNDATNTADDAKKIPISGIGINGVYSGAGTIAFGNLRVGNNAQTTYTITNVGDDTLFLSAPSVSGAGFTLVSGSAQNIPPNGTSSVVVKFSPTAKQAYSGTLTMTAQNGVSVPSITITGTGSAPILTALPAASYDLGLINVGGSLPGSVQITNTGDDTLHVTSISIPNTQQGSKFTLTSPTSFILLPTASSNITFSYTSATESTDAATLNFTGDDAQGARQISLNARSGLPKMSVDTKDTTDFGSVRLGASGNAFLTIKNVGTYNLVVQMTDFSPAVFTLGSLPQTVTPQGITQATIVFTPAVEGPVTGMAIVQGNDNSNPRDTVFFKGVGINTALDFPTSVDFHQLNLSKTSDTVLTLVNRGSADAKILKYSLTDANHGFVLVDTAAHTIPAKDSVKIKVRFKPTVETAYAGTLNILTDDAAAANRQITLAGVGVNSKLTTNLSSIDFGTIDSGKSSTKTFTITNTGSASTTITDVKLTGSSTFTMTAVTPPPPFTLDAGAGKDITAIFAPLANGTFDGTVTITASEGSPIAISLHGKGNVPVIINSVAVGSHDAGLKMMLFPNPNNGSATVKFTLEKPLNVAFALFDATGKIVHQYKESSYNTGEYTLQLAGETLPSGEYYLRAISEKATAAEMKVLIVR